MARDQKTEFDVARDELMSHIHRCGVLKASDEQQLHWLSETMEYLAERYHSLSETEIDRLQEMGRRFCQPVIAHGESERSPDAGDHDKMVGAA